MYESPEIGCSTISAILVDALLGPDGGMVVKYSMLRTRFESFIFCGMGFTMAFPYLLEKLGGAG
jgi:hypothetical protein